MAVEVKLEERIDAETARLVAEFGDLIGEDHVRKLVTQVADSFRESTVGDFVPLFIHRYVREQLKGVQTNV